jgi:hypothetical protein
MVLSEIGSRPSHHGFQGAVTPQCEMRPFRHLETGEQRMMRGRPTRRPGRGSASAGAELGVDVPSGCRSILGPPEFGAVSPNAVQDDS